MNMEEYPSNSNKSKREAETPPEKKVEKIVSTAKTKKKSGISKFTDVFVSDDVNNIKSYILMDVLIPTVKKALSDIVTNGVEMLLYGETGHTKSSSRADRVSYGKYYDRDRDRDRDKDRYRTRATYEYDDVVVETRGEAQRVIDRMEEIVEEYGTVSVADLYDLVGITGRYTDNKYGWTDLRTARTERVRDGYLIKLPRAEAFD